MEFKLYMNQKSLKKQVDMTVDSHILPWQVGEQPLRTGGPWQNAHELPGATSCNTSSQDIPEEQNQDVSTHISTAVAYINNTEGTELVDMAKSL